MPVLLYIPSCDDFILHHTVLSLGCLKNIFFYRINLIKSTKSAIVIHHSDSEIEQFSNFQADPLQSHFV